MKCLVHDAREVVYVFHQIIEDFAAREHLWCYYCCYCHYYSCIYCCYYLYVSRVCAVKYSIQRAVTNKRSIYFAANILKLIYKQARPNN